MSKAKQILRDAVNRGFERKMLGRNDDRTRYIKFAAFLACYDSDDDVIKDAAAMIREMADRIKEQDALLAKLSKFPERWKMEYHNIYMGDDDFKHGRKAALHQAANAVDAILDGK